MDFNLGLGVFPEMTCLLLLLRDQSLDIVPMLLGFGGSINTAAIMDFVDAGHDLILVADESASDLIREVATECGVDFDEVVKSFITTFV